jgi:hypothetical protein
MKLRYKLQGAGGIVKKPVLRVRIQTDPVGNDIPIYFLVYEKCYKFTLKFSVVDPNPNPK